MQITNVYVFIIVFAFSPTFEHEGDFLSLSTNDRALLPWLPGHLQDRQTVICGWVFINSQHMSVQLSVLRIPFFVLLAHSGLIVSLHWVLLWAMASCGSVMTEQNYTEVDCSTGSSYDATAFSQEREAHSDWHKLSCISCLSGILHKLHKSHVFWSFYDIHCIKHRHADLFFLSEKLSEDLCCLIAVFHPSTGCSRIVRLFSIIWPDCPLPSPAMPLLDLPSVHLLICFHSAVILNRTISAYSRPVWQSLNSQCLEFLI